MADNMTWVVLVVLAGIALASASSNPKHVIFFLIDDLGHSDASYMKQTYPNVTFGFLPPTPAVDELALNGVRLESYYVAQLCSPTRTSLLSGRYPYTIGMNAEVIVDGHPSCLPTNVKTVADHLQEAGWATSAYGKWDAGMTAWGCTPTCRGFDHFNGFYNAFNDYFTHRVGPGLDLRKDFEPDFANDNETGVYETELITSRVNAWIEDTMAKRPQNPTFAFVAHQANHAPMQAPMSYITGPCEDNIPASHPTRRVLCGMMRAVDASVKNITDTYKRLGIWNDTVVIFSTDNGGNPDTGGNNWPFRGMKATTFEGGVRGLGFVHWPGFSPAVRGAVSQEIVSVADWLPTIVHGIAGLPLNESDLNRLPGGPQPPPLDGLDQWPSITQGLPSPRTEVLINLIATACQSPNCKVPGQGAIRVGRYKLLHGHTSVWMTKLTESWKCAARSGKPDPHGTLPATAATSPPWCPNGWVPHPSSGLEPIVPPDAGCTGLPCNFTNSDYIEGGTFLFDVVDDPYERHNLAAEKPDVVAQLLARLQAFNATNIPQDNSPVDPASNPAKFGGVWTPWRGDPDPKKCSTNTTVPGSKIRSNFDGLACPSVTDCQLTGWLWNKGQPDGGIAPMHVHITLDGKTIVEDLIANVSRPGLVPKTGAPNSEHGFVVQLNTADVHALRSGKHSVAAFAVLETPKGFLKPLQNSPRCYCATKLCNC